MEEGGEIEDNGGRLRGREDGEEEVDLGYSS